MAAYEKQGESDEWYTPAYIFEALGVQFDLDVACPPEGPRHVPARNFFCNGALEKSWYGVDEPAIRSSEHKAKMAP